MNKLLVSLGLASLLLCVGCGYGGSSNAGFGGGGVSGNFSNSSVSGQYVYQVSGTDVSGNAFFQESGVFTADGKGNITSGEDDLAEGGSVSSTATTGNYSISSDGTGSVVINFGGGNAIQLAATVINSRTVYLTASQVANGALVNGSGMAELQTTGVSVPSGTFTFRLHTLGTSQGSSSSVGVFSVSAGSVTGSEDVIRGGLLSSLTLTSGLFNTPDTSGRGTGSVTDSSGFTSTFLYYVVSPSSMRLFSTTGGSTGLGRADAQSGPFSNSSFSGGYAFRSVGDDSFAVGGRQTVGRFTAGGDGTISAGNFDSVVDGNPSSNLSSTGTYTIAANGRAVVTTNPSSGGTVQQVYWFVNPTEAFFLTSDTTKVEDGVATQQSSGTFSNSTMNGIFGLEMTGFNSGGPFDRVGTLHWDGSGNLGLNEFANSSGTGNIPGILNGHYSVSSNGRTTGSISNVSNNFVFYLISGSSGYALQEDTSTEVSGQFSKQ